MVATQNFLKMQYFRTKNPENADSMPDRLARSRDGLRVAMPSQLHSFVILCKGPRKITAQGLRNFLLAVNFGFVRDNVDTASHSS